MNETCANKKAHWKQIPKPLKLINGGVLIRSGGGGGKKSKIINGGGGRLFGTVEYVSNFCYLILKMILCFAPFRSSTDSLFPRLNILKFPDLITINNCIFVFDYINNNLPISLSGFFTKTKDIHHQNTRNVDNAKLYVPLFRTFKYGKFSIEHQCILAWNASLVSLKFSSEERTIFDLSRMQYKNFLYSSFFNNYNESFT